jgi:alpha-L-fucosidase
MINKKTSVLVFFFLLIAVIFGLIFFFRGRQESSAQASPAERAPAAALRDYVRIGSGDDLETIVRKAAEVAPSPAQLAWQEREFTAFTHFGMNTFTDREWGQGTEDPRLFNPTDFDARQWVRAIKAGGMKMLILTAKHHDGFCLWPSALTAHSVKSSPWKGGKGDVVAEVSAACREAGLAFGIYLSPWDRHEPTYGDSARYNEHFRGQLRELLTNYGPIAEVWFDGANGEGPNGKRQVYDWPSYYKVIRELQPQAVIFGMAPDVRWVGTESGYGRETEWSVVPADVQDPALTAANSQRHPQDAAFSPRDLTGDDLGSREKIKNAKALTWYPAETDVSIRPGWFYHAKEDAQVKTPDKLVDIYFSSVGRNGVLLLNIPPDKRGRITDFDVSALRGMRRILDETFKNDFASPARVQASSQDAAHPAAAAVDADPKSYWSPASSGQPVWIEIDLGAEKTFDCALLGEMIANGQRVEAFRLEAWTAGEWKDFAKGTTVGYKRLLRFPAVTAAKVRLTIEQTRAIPQLARFELYKMAEPAGLAAEGRGDDPPAR